MKYATLCMLLLPIWLSLSGCNSVCFPAGTRSRTIANLEIGNRQTIVMYGTSLTLGGAWVEQLNTALKDEFRDKATIINSGQSGANSDWGLQNVTDRVVAKHPDCVLIEFSINDAVSTAIPEAKSKSNLNGIIDSIRKSYPECEIVLMTMNPRPEASCPAATMTSYYDVCRKVASDRQCMLVDNYPIWVGLQSRNIGLYNVYVPDGCHPTAQACENIVTPNILKALGLFKYGTVNFK